MVKKLLLKVFTFWALILTSAVGWGQTCPTSVSLTSDMGNTICDGTTVNFIATPNGGSGTFSYQWKIGSSVQGETGNTLTRSNLTNSQKVYVTVTEVDGVSCTTNEASITMTVQDIKTPNVNISVPSGTKCLSDNITFTATPTNGGTSSSPPNYAWYIDGSSTASQNGSSASFSTNNLTAGNHSIRVVMTSGLTCITSATAENSKNFTITDNATISVPDANQTVCINEDLAPIVFDIGGSGTGASVTGLPSGLSGSYSSSSGNFTISGSPTVAGTFDYIVTTSGLCENVSESGQIIVNPDATISLDSGSTIQTVCQGEAIEAIVYGIGQTGDGATLNGLPAGITGSFANGQFTISGSDNTIGTHNYTITATGDCENSQTLNGSIIINENLTPTVSLSSNDADNIICDGTEITYTASITYGGSSPTYQWLINGDPQGSATSSNTFTRNNLENGDVVSVELTSSEFCTTSKTAGASAPAITVNPNLTPSVAIEVTDSDICTGNEITFSIDMNSPETNNLGTTPLSYNWKLDGNTVGTDATYTTSTITDGQTVTLVVTSSEACLTTDTAISQAISIEVYPPEPDTPGPIYGELQVCHNWNGLNYSVPEVTNAFSYEWSLPSGWIITAGEFTNSITVNAGNGDGIISVVALSENCGYISTPSEITVTSIDAVPADPGPITSDLSENADAACPPATANFSVAATGDFEWTVPDGWDIVSGAGTNSIQVNITNAAGSGTHSVSVVSQNICGDSTPSTYDNIVIDNHIIADFGDDQTVCSTVNAVQLNGTRSFGDATLEVNFETSGSGTFSGSNVGGNNKNGPFSVTYNPSQADKNNGSVTLTMTVPEPRRQDNTGNDCGASEDSVTINFIQDATISTPSNIDETVCLNQALTDISFNITDAGTNASVTGLPAGLSGNFDSETFTISGTPTESGIFNYTVETLGDCAQQTSISGNITVLADNIITDASNKDQEICINNQITNIAFPFNETVASVNTSGLPAGISGNIVGNEFILTGTPIESGTFNYTLVTSGSCVSAETTGTLTVQPDITISSPSNKQQTVCINSSISDIEFTITDPGTGANITGDLPAGLNTSFNNGIFTISGSPAEAGTFNYTVNTEGPCENATESGIITVEPDPTATISYDAEFCTSQSEGIPVILNGTGAEETDWQGGTFSASPDGLSIDSNTGTITASTSTPGNYTVTYQGPDTCVRAEATTTVVINPTPTVELSYDGPFCNSNSALQSPNLNNGIGAWEGGIFSYNKTDGLALNPTTGEINPATSSPGDYIVTYTTPVSKGCSEQVVTADVKITQLPNPSITYPATACTSASSISVDFGTTPEEYKIGTFSATNGLSIDASGTIDPTTSSAGLHTITYTVAAANGCEDVVATKEIEIFEKVVINTEPINLGICSSETATFEVVASGSNLTYQWYRNVNGTPEAIPGEIDPILTITTANSTDAGSYYVEVSGHNSCNPETSEPAILNVDENIVITEPTEDITICENAEEEVLFTFKGHANGAPLSFAWYKDGEIVTENPGKIDFTVIDPDENDPLKEYEGRLKITGPDLEDSGIYYVMVDGPDYFTCSEAVSPNFKFTVNPPDPAPTTTDITYCLNDETAPLTATVNSGNEIKWYDENYTFLGDTFSPPTTEVGTFIYYATQTKYYPNSNNTGVIGCESDFAPLTVTVLPKPEPLSSSTLVFKYCFEEEVTEALVINPSGIGEEVLWYEAEIGGTSLDAPLPNTLTAATTTYWVSQSTAEGCESQRTKVEIVVNPLPNLQITVADSGEPKICLGSVINLVASGASSYSWTLDGNEVGTEANLTHEPTNTGINTYILSGTDENGCSNIIEIDIEVEMPSNGGLLTGPASVCTGENSGTLSLADELGAIVRWESSTDGSNWTVINEVSNEYSFQNLSQATTFRVAVKNGVCSEVYSNEVNIAIDPLPVAGQILFRGTDRVFMMCEFPTDDYLVPLQTNGTYIGDVVAWQYRRNSQSEWTTIMDGSEPFTGYTLSGTQVNEAANNESTLFRVEVQSGACSPNVYSDYATLSIIPSDIAPNPVTITRPEICLGDFIELSSGTGYGGYGTFLGGAFDNSSIANHGWRVKRFDNDTEYTFQSAADNTRPERWMRTNPHEYIMADPEGGNGTVWQEFDSSSGDEGNKGFAIVSGDNPSTLETPVFNLYATDNPVLTFDQAYNLTAGDVITVQISMDGGNTYVNEPLFIVQGPAVSGNYDRFGDDGLGEPNNMSIDLSAYAGLGNLRIRWLYDGTTGGIYTIDDIGIPQDPENVQLIWYYDEDPNDPNNELEQIGEINQSTVQYTPTKIGWNYFQVNTALVFDTNGDPCQSAENQATIQVYVFDSYTTTASANAGSCGSSEVPLQATLKGIAQGEVTEFFAEDTSTVAWTVLNSPEGYTFSEDHFTTTGDGPAINDPNATFLPPVQGEYTLEYTITPDERNTCEIISGSVSFNFAACTTLDFDGVDDYVDLETSYGGYKLIEAWIRPFERPNTEDGMTDPKTGSIISGPGFDVNMQQLSSKFIPNGRWYHIAVSNTGEIYIDGIPSGSVNTSSSQSNKTIIGARWNATTKTTENHFSGWIEEVRIWNNPPSPKELKFMMNQRLKLSGGTVVSPLEGEVVPNRTTTGSYHTSNGNNLDWEDEPFYDQTAGDLAGYYRLISAEPDPVLNIILNTYQPSNGETPELSGNGVPGRLHNMTTHQQNTSPTPYFSGADGDWATDATWARPDVWDPPYSAGIKDDDDDDPKIKWNIARTSHMITSGSKKIKLLGLISEAGVLDMEGSVPSVTGNELFISHYLDLNGIIDLNGESQLVQPHGSLAVQTQTVDTEITGYLERDQQGTASSFNYNYWSSPVSDAFGNTNYTVGTTMFDGSITGTGVFNPITFSEGPFSADTPWGNGSPISITDFWIHAFFPDEAGIYINWSWIKDDAPISIGEGYTMKGAWDVHVNEGKIQNYTFKGFPNNGNISMRSISPDQNYLIGNPYPSAVDVIKFIDQNQGKMNGALYFWDHFAEKSHYLQEYIGGYATRSRSIGVPAAASDHRINATNDHGTKVPGPYIPVGQGFFINSTPTSETSITSGIPVFNNTQRTFYPESNNGDETAIFHSAERKDIKSSTKQASSNGIPIIRLNYTSPKGFWRQIAVGAIEKTTADFDYGEDAPLLDDFKEDMYWLINGRKYVIQGVPDFGEQRVLKLGLKIDKAGEFSIELAAAKNLQEEKGMYILDRNDSLYHDLRAEKFTKKLKPGVYNERFELVFSKPGTIIEPEEPEEPILEDGPLEVIYVNGSREVLIKNPELLDISRIYLNNMLGQQVHVYFNVPKDREVTLPVQRFSAGVYIVKMHTEKGIIARKVILE